jgi:hypothetical protein
MARIPAATSRIPIHFVVFAFFLIPSMMLIVSFLSFGQKVRLAPTTSPPVVPD